MPDRHPFISIIATSAAFSVAVFGALQYVQVIPLEREVAKLNEQLNNKDKSIRISPEYQELNNLYAQQKARSEILEEELKNNSGLEGELVKTKLMLESAKDKASKLEGYENYGQIAADLDRAKDLLEQYKEAYDKVLAENENLRGSFSIKEEIDELVEKRTEIERVIDCMLHGCNWAHLTKYDEKYEQVAYLQHDSQLKSINKQIEVLYTKLK